MSVYVCHINLSILGRGAFLILQLSRALFIFPIILGILIIHKNLTKDRYTKIGIVSSELDWV